MKWKGGCIVIVYAHTGLILNYQANMIIILFIGYHNTHSYLNS